MGPNTEVISYRFKTASAITGFQQTLNHREWEYFQPLSAHGPCLFPACSCVISLGWLGRERGLCWDCPGSAESALPAHRWLLCSGGLGSPGGQSWASSLVPALLPIPLSLHPSHLAVTLQQRIWGKHGRCLKSLPSHSGSLRFSVVETIRTRIWVMAAEGQWVHGFTIQNLG